MNYGRTDMERSWTTAHSVTSPGSEGVIDPDGLAHGLFAGPLRLRVFFGDVADDRLDLVGGARLALLPAAALCLAVAHACLRSTMRARVPATVHEDATGRLQSVTAERNPRYHALISAFHALTGVPVILNTSFNIMGKPILHTAEDAILMFYTSGLDALVIEDWLLVK